MANQVKEILKVLQKMHEDQVTCDVIIPHFEDIGFSKVDFNGRNPEAGKDIIIWNEDFFGDMELWVAQVKHHKPSRTASDTKSLQTIVNQLTMCFNKTHVYTDQNPYRPSKVILISTHPIDSKTMETRFDTYPTLEGKKIKIIDGHDLAKALIESSPKIVRKLMGVNFEIKSKLKPSFSNKFLLDALKSKKIKDLGNIYTDIDFSLGKRTSHYFFHAKFQPEALTKTISVSEWERLEPTIIQIEKVLSKKIVSHKLNSNDKKAESQEQYVFNTKKAIQLESSELKRIQQYISKLNKKRNDELKKLERLNEQDNQFVYSINEAVRKYSLKLDIELSQEAREELMEIKRGELVKEREKERKYILKQLTQVKHDVNGTRDLLNKVGKLQLKTSGRLDYLNDELSRISYKLTINAKLLADEITKKRHWIESRVAEFNELPPNTEELKVFIEKCSTILHTASLIFKAENKAYFSCLGHDIDSNIEDEDRKESNRFRLGIEQVFNTGLNISVLGDAGAGKSTSLEMYAQSMVDSEKLVMPVPLGYAIKLGIENSKEKEIRKDIENLEPWLWFYTKSVGVDRSLEEFKNLLENENVLLLLDGLDEAIKLAPWLPKAASKLEKKYPNLQIILSSRMYGPYLEEIPFFPVTLLPFTDPQRNSFIKSWFNEEPEGDIIIKKIQDHLLKNKAISEIIRNPLLTTTLCVLAGHKLSLPKTEVKLYEQRLMLLTGYYDNVKHIVTRISTSPNILNKLAQKLAYYLHSNATRSEYKDTLESHAIKVLSNHLRKEEAIEALNELIDPCEILIPMSPDGKYGFGHLRYQEHLVAKEFSNRSIDIKPLLYHDWWHGAIMIYSRMSDDMEWFVRSIGETAMVGLPVIEKIIESRNIVEREKLFALYQKYRFLKFNDFSEFDNEHLDELDDDDYLISDL